MVEDDLASGDLPGVAIPPQGVQPLADEDVLLVLEAVLVEQKSGLDLHFGRPNVLDVVVEKNLTADEAAFFVHKPANRSTFRDHLHALPRFVGPCILSSKSERRSAICYAGSDSGDTRGEERG